MRREEDNNIKKRAIKEKGVNLKQAMQAQVVEIQIVKRHNYCNKFDHMIKNYRGLLGELSMVYKSISVQEQDRYDTYNK